MAEHIEITDDEREILRDMFMNRYEVIDLRDGLHYPLEYFYIDKKSLLDLAEKLVVRCKDCKFHTYEEPGMVYCPTNIGGWVEEDFFCKDGERRE